MSLESQEILESIKSSAGKDFIQMIGRFCDSLHVENNASDHTVRNYKNDLFAYLI